MSDPHELEMEDYIDITIFEPESVLERLMGSQIFKVLGYTIAGLVLMALAGAVLIISLIPFQLVEINPYTGSIWISPIGFVILSATEILLIVTPIHYVRQKKLPLRSIGIKAKHPIKQLIIGLFVGLFMIGVNVVVSWIVSIMPGSPPVSDTNMFSDMTIVDAILLSIVMMIIVGPTEEILFRGFLQRRLEIYYHNKNKNYRLWALVIASIIFSVTHLDIAGLATRFVLGLILGYLAQRQRYSLLAPAIAHGTNNTLVILLAFLGY